MLDEKTIATLKESHGSSLMAVEFPDGKILVFRKPTRFEYDRFRDTFNPDGNKVTPIRELAKTCVVHPSEQDLNECLDAYPAVLGNEIFHVLQDMAGHNLEIATKKL